MPGSIQSIERAAAVLQLLGAAREPVALSEIAQTLALAKPTVHGIIRTLCDVGFVGQEHDTGRYLLTGRLATLGEGLDPHLLRSRAMTWADGLAARTGLEVQIGITGAVAGAAAAPGGVDTLEVLHHVFRPDGSPQRLRVGEHQPLHATALGLVLLAFAPSTARLHRLPMTRYTASTVVDREVLGRLVRAVRRQGWAHLDGGYRPDVAAIAAPIRHHLGVGVGAIAVVGPRERLLAADGVPLDPLRSHVVETAERISSHLQEKL